MATHYWNFIVFCIIPERLWHFGSLLGPFQPVVHNWFIKGRVCVNSLSWSPGVVPCLLIKYESEPVGSLLLNLTATPGMSGNKVTIEINQDSTAELVNITKTTNSGGDNWTASVILKKELDRDFAPSTRDLYFKAVEQNKNTSPLTCKLKILDVNQHPPTFLNLPYHTQLPETTPQSTVIFYNISTKDPDLDTRVTYEMVSDPVNDVMFKLETVGSNGARIILLEHLDYETRNSYTIRVNARDGDGLNDSVDVIVTVEDVQDTPPYFLADVYRAAIKEETIAGASVIQIQAEDGDRGSPNPVRYAIIEGNTDYFFINSTTGWITTIKPIDRDASPATNTDGVFDLLVQAMELNNTLPQLGNTTTTTHVYVTVDDVNDHCPVFGAKTYTAFVREDTPNGTLIYFQGDGYMKVEDQDQGLNAKFRLMTEKDGSEFDLFTPSPRNTFAEAFVLVRLMNNTRLRELVDTHIIFQIVAQETNTSERCSGTANVVLAVERFSEPSTTTPVPLTKELTASDIVVFVICFLIFLNIMTSVIVCYLVKTRTVKERKDRNGLTRHGSKYYMKQTDVSIKNGGLPEMTEITPEVSVYPRENHQEVAQ